MAILLDMTRTHVPVLAGELIDLLDPHPGETAIDCTFGDGGHARLVADRIGPTGTLICIDRDPAAEERFDAFSREVACDTRFLRMDNASALELLWNEHVEADIAYRAGRLAAGGPLAAFADLHELGSWRDGALVVDRKYDSTVELGGRGLLLVPVAFAWPLDLATIFASQLAGVLATSAQAVTKV